MELDLGRTEDRRAGSTEAPARPNTPSARPPTQLFDWRVTCPEDVARPFPPIAGPGRGTTLAEVEARRKMGDQGAAREAPVK